jgi:anti-sigma regulatory factor (Ser/Thr protein kinase)/PAS domain-containing protein
MEGKDFENYKKNYHLFSYHAQDVQNLLFNLKLQTSEYPEINTEIINLRNLHQEITSEFTGHIVDMKQYNFRNLLQKKEKTKGKDREILAALNNIADTIEAASWKRTDFTINFYLIIASLSFSVFISILLVSGRRIGRLLVKTNAILEEMVMERTREYMETNLSLEKEIEEHKETEAKLIESRNETENINRLLSISEKKYRVIVEGTGDIIFTLDNNFHFLNANRAIKELLKINPDNILNYNFYDIIYKNPIDNDVSEAIIKEKLDQLKTDIKRVEFPAEFKTTNMIEPLELTVTLETIETGGHNEIIGKASKASADKTSHFFISEKCEYSITNQLLTADTISHKITENLSRYIPRNDLNLLRMALREMIINSIEHGNLNITFEEKSQALMTDNYIELLNSRQKDPDNASKKVKIEYLISPKKAIYKITDQGKGFNHKKIMSMNGEDTNNNYTAHGRGIAMTRSIFDEVKYNLKGNQVLLVKYLEQ